MRRLILCLVVASAAIALTASVGSAKNDRGVVCVMHAKLAAKNEVPPTTSTAKGHTHIKVRTDGTIEFKTKINNRDHENFVAAHIHEGPVDGIGDVVVPLLPPPPATSARHIKEKGVATPNPTEPTATGEELCNNPSAFYVNYHTNPGFPLGAIRGQLR
jgi:CHRD domain